MHFVCRTITLQLMLSRALKHCQACHSTSGKWRKRFCIGESQKTRETGPLIEVSLFSWPGDEIVPKPSTASARSLFPCVIKTNKPWDQKPRQALEDGTERFQHMAQASSVGESKRETVSWAAQWKIIPHSASHHHISSHLQSREANVDYK